MLIDTHAHLYLEDFMHDTEEVIQRAYSIGVKKIILPNIDSGSIKKLFDLADAYPQICFPLIGLHPTSVESDYREELEAVEYWLGKRKVYGIGEIGIDLYWDKTRLQEQVNAFRYQLKIAKDNKLPVVIHVRESFEEVITVVREEQDGTLRGIFHCFNGTLQEAEAITGEGFFLGIGGVVTFKNSNLSEVIKQVDISHLVLETDSPYLAPVPKRGQRNESSYLYVVAQKVAEIKSCSVENIAKVTSENARSLFGI
jgi:TatD DNase family protein